MEGTTLTYTYDDLGQLEGFGYPKDPGNWSTKVNLDYTYDTLGWVKQRDDNGTGKPMNEYMELSGQSLVKKVEYRYCRTCAGNRTERIETDEYGEIIEWLRYEMEGLNHLRIDERYDSPSDGNAVLDDEDPFRVQRVYYNGPGQLGQIAKVQVWDYSGQNPTSTDYYYGYDILGNVSVISNANGAEADQFEQDAFGNEVESSWSSPAGGITEHLTTKQCDADLGLYYFNARWYDPGTGAFISCDPANLQYNGKAYRLSCGDKRRIADDSIFIVLPRYALAFNAPTMKLDPSGRYPGEACEKAFNAAASHGAHNPADFCMQACLDRCHMTDPNPVAPKAGAFFMQCLDKCQKSRECIKALLDFYQCVQGLMTGGIKQPVAVAECLCKLPTKCK